MLSKQAIREFQEIYLKTYGKELSLVDATAQATQLIRLYKAIYKPNSLNLQKKELSHEQSNQ